MGNIPVVVCIDIEPDRREIDLKRREPWLGCVEGHKLFSSVRTQLEAATASPVHFSWFLRMDPQIEFVYGSAVWVVQNFPDIVADWESHGDELGLHVHATRWNETLCRWVGDYGDSEWVEQCVTSSFAAFEAALHRPCRSVSFGDRWNNNETVALVEKLGAKYHLSVEPGGLPNGAELGHPFTGSWEGYRRAPHHPYRPSPADFQKEAATGRNIWMIPLSAGTYEGPKALRLWRLKRLLTRLGFYRQRQWESQTLRLHILPELFKNTLDGLLKIDQVTHLALVVRSDACIESPQRVNLVTNLEYLRLQDRVANFRFVTPAEAISMLNPDSTNGR